MRWIIICFLFINCSDDMITISDALPIQFWDIDDETFNEKSECGITEACFCQPINSDDPQTIQIEGEGGESYILIVLNSYGDTIDEINFTQIGATLIFSAEFDPSDYEGQKISLQIGQNELSAVVTDDFTTDLMTWVNGSGGTPVWAWSADSGGSAQQTTINTFPGKVITRATTLPNQLCYLRITFDPIPTPASSDLQITVQLRTSTTATLANIILVDVTESSGEATGIISTPSYWTDTTHIAIFLASTGYVAGDTVNIKSFEILTDVPEPIKKSDCLDIKESHDCTKLIEYSNESDFDGIVYSDISPRPVFYLRIPAMFFEEDNPQEQEDLVLSNGVIVTLRQEIQEKRLLETGYMPNYMHKKLQKVLMHESITIDGDGWKRRDAYESNPIKKYALKRASVLLTKYNSVLKNTI